MTRPLTLQDELAAVAWAGERSEAEVEHEARASSAGMGGGVSAPEAKDDALHGSNDAVDLLEMDMVGADEADMVAHDAADLVAPAAATSPIASEAPVVDSETSAFAERFKYLVCSSGLLEKDFIADRAAPVDVAIKSSSASAGGWLAAAVESASVKALLRGAEAATARPDIAGAALIVLVGMGVIIGWIWLLLGVSVLAVSGILLASPSFAAPAASVTVSVAVVQSDKPLVRSSPRDLARHTAESLLFTSSSLDTSLSRSLALLDDNHFAAHQALRAALHRLCDRMTDHLASASSTLGALVDKHELELLAEMHDIPLVRRKVDSNSWEETRTLGSVPSPRRLPVPLRLSPPSTVRPSRSRTFRMSMGQTQMQMQMQRAEPVAGWAMTASRSLPPVTPASRSRHAHHLSLLPSLPLPTAGDVDANASDDRFTSVPRRTPRISKRASWDPVGWSRAKDLGALGLTSEARGATSQPLPVPDILERRHQRRITEADESEDEPGSGLRPLSLPASPTPSRGAHTPKRTSPLSGRSNSHSQTLRPSLTESAMQLAQLSLSLSPESDAELEAFAGRSSKRSSVHVPLHVPMSANPKRRSLQNLAYYPSSDADMQRSASNSSDLQRARSHASATEGERIRSRRASVHSNVSVGSMQSLHSLGSMQSLRSGLLSPPRSATAARFAQRQDLTASPRQTLFPRVNRVPSISPLTAPALQAACLGVHLKRRRVACELLALKWEGDASYWEEVRAVLSALEEQMKEELAGLEKVRASAVVMTILGLSVEEEARPPWRHIVSGDNGDSVDWAPRLSEEQLILDRVELVQRELEVAWRASMQVRATVVGGESAAVQRAWADLKSSVSSLVHNVEQGREHVRALSLVQSAGGMLGPPSDEEAESGVPDFAQSWEDDACTARSTSIGTSTSVGPDAPLPPREAVPEEDGVGAEWARETDLPAVGKDTVYEAHVPLVDPLEARMLEQRAALGRMTREERIAISRRAREEGVGVVQLLKRLNGSGEVDDGVYDDGNGTEGGAVGAREREVLRSGVVQELQGLMGMIRRRKGEGEGEGPSRAGEVLGDERPVGTFERRGQNGEMNVGKRDEEAFDAASISPTVGASPIPASARRPVPIPSKVSIGRVANAESREGALPTTDPMEDLRAQLRGAFVALPRRSDTDEEVS